MHSAHVRTAPAQPTSAHCRSVDAEHRKFCRLDEADPRQNIYQFTHVSAEKMRNIPLPFGHGLAVWTCFMVSDNVDPLQVWGSRGWCLAVNRIRRPWLQRNSFSCTAARWHAPQIRRPLGLSKGRQACDDICPLAVSFPPGAKKSSSLCWPAGLCPTKG